MERGECIRQFGSEDLECYRLLLVLAAYNPFFLLTVLDVLILLWGVIPS